MKKTTITARAHSRAKGILSLLVIVTLLIASCKKNIESTQKEEKAIDTTERLSQTPLIPKAVEVTDQNGDYDIFHTQAILLSENTEEMNRIGNELSSALKGALRLNVPVAPAISYDTKENILLSLEPSNPKVSKKESYLLQIKKDGVQLTAKDGEGIFRGMQTLLQLIPAVPANGLSAFTDSEYLIPAGTINDYPEYAYRGAMLDVARHFSSVATVKKYIDELAMYKINHFHMHLSDDQGWRIEIKSWPKLTEIGGSSAVNGDPGGFYTQEEFKDIIKYAADRYITIIPEIDMPGHTNAALASYAELNCDGIAPPLYTGIEVGFSSLCIDKDITYEFVDDVIREIAEMSPAPYIHIGGDESLSTPKDKYIPFVQRVEEIVKKHGKQMIGWEEVATATKLSTSVSQYWKEESHAKEAVNKGMKIIFSPANRAYMDIKYNESTPLGLSWPGYVNTEKSYSWTPQSEVPGISKDQVLGVEGPMFSETILNIKDIEFMAFPRIMGIAEIGWSPNAQLDWKEYKERLATYSKRMKVMDINYYASPLVPWK